MKRRVSRHPKQSGNPCAAALEQAAEDTPKKLEERIRFFLSPLPFQIAGRGKQSPPASVILNREERQKAASSQRSYGSGAVLRRQYSEKSLLSAQIRDCLTSYVDSLRMRDTTVPEAIRSSLSARLDPLLKEGIAQLQQVCRRDWGEILPPTS